MILECARTWAGVGGTCVLVAIALAQPQTEGVAGARARDGTLVRGVTISTHTSGSEWASDAFARELDELREIGVNWVAIHPYAAIRSDGSLSWSELDPDSPPEWIARPIREAHARGMSILVVPHIAQWGSPWNYRSEIAFTESASRDRFFADYTRWITAVAACARGADGFAVGSELDRLTEHESSWRAVIAAVRGSTEAHLTYAASWNCYRAVAFWDALDAIGVQAYFPLSSADAPTAGELAAAWRPILSDMHDLHLQTGKPVVFTELGYNRSLDAAREPWAYPQANGPDAARAEALQVRCLASALSAIEGQSNWLRGAILWKWFVRSDRHEHRARRENFLMSEPAVRAAIAVAWAGKVADGAPR